MTFLDFHVSVAQWHPCVIDGWWTPLQGLLPGPQELQRVPVRAGPADRRAPPQDLEHEELQGSGLTPRVHAGGGATYHLLREDLWGDLTNMFNNQSFCILIITSCFCLCIMGPHNAPPSSGRHDLQQEAFHYREAERPCRVLLMAAQLAAL